jgi:protein required for attachment to host cells
MRLPHDALVLVTDGRKYVLFRNDGDAARLNLQTDRHDEQPNAKDRDLHTDAPGTQNQRFGHARPAMDETDFHQQAEDRLAKQIAKTLNARALAGQIEALAVIAPARTMGILRLHWHERLSRRIVGEITKEMVDRPTPDIEALLQGDARPPA